VTGGWRDSRPELVIAVIAVAAVCGAALAFAGAAAAVIIFIGAGVGALAVLRFLTPADDLAPSYEGEREPRGRTTFVGFYRRRAEVESAVQTMTTYDVGLRGTLQHLLAARLAERHGISLYDDPAAARRVLAAGGSDRLWFWLDPERPAVADQGSSGGIPLRTLTAIIDRLERL
jgi:hypothetical protein